MISQSLHFCGPNWIGWACADIFLICQKPTLRVELMINIPSTNALHFVIRNVKSPDIRDHPLWFVIKFKSFFKKCLCSKKVLYIDTVIPWLAPPPSHTHLNKIVNNCNILAWPPSPPHQCSEYVLLKKNMWKRHTSNSAK